MMRVVLASNNAKKLSELQALLHGVPVTLVTQGSLGIAEAEEPHHTFLENALAKARHAAAAANGPALADDSGICARAVSVDHIIASDNAQMTRLAGSKFSMDFMVTFRMSFADRALTAYCCRGFGCAQLGSRAAIMHHRIFPKLRLALFVGASRVM